MWRQWRSNRPQIDFPWVRLDTLASLDALPQARQQVRSRRPVTTTLSVLRLERIRAALDLSQAHNAAPGRDPIYVRPPVRLSDSGS